MNNPIDLVSGVVRLKLEFAYDGTDFAGWAKQPDQRTVQGEILRALSNVFEQHPDSFELVVAGRTDAGVHAAAQVAHLDLTTAQFEGPGRNLRQRLNSLLDSDIRIYSVQLAPAGFDARFSAIYRRYVYRIADGSAAQNPVESRNTLFLWKHLDLLAMQDAAQELIGLGDFASFCKPRPGSTTIRELKHIKLRRLYSRGNLIEIELKADAFCHNMVRSIVGALVAVGDGRATRADIARLFARNDRVGSYKVVSAHGLTLAEIGYPADEKLAFQAENAKALRTLDDSDESE